MLRSFQDLRTLLADGFRTVINLTRILQVFGNRANHRSDRVRRYQIFPSKRLISAQRVIVDGKSSSVRLGLKKYL